MLYVEKLRSAVNGQSAAKFLLLEKKVQRLLERGSFKANVKRSGSFPLKEKDIVCSLWKHRAWVHLMLLVLRTNRNIKESAMILNSKIEEICTLIPALANEIVWDTRGKIATTSRTKDSVEIAFKNGSTLRNAAMSENTRGARFQSLLVEEVAKVDQDKLTEIIMPTLVISRKINGEADPKEILNQSAIFVTSAGYKNTYSYEKLIDTLCLMVARPKEAFILGGDWRIKLRVFAIKTA